MGFVPLYKLAIFLLCPSLVSHGYVIIIILGLQAADLIPLGIQYEACVCVRVHKLKPVSMCVCVCVYISSFPIYLVGRNIALAVEFLAY